MYYWKNIFAVGLLAASTNSVAEVYYHIGGGLDIVTHDKSLEKSYPMIDFKAGLGYKLNEQYALEWDITAVSTSDNGTDEGICSIDISTNKVVSCTSKNEKISRLMTIGSVVYNTEINNTKSFVKAGVGLVRSGFRSSGDSEGRISKIFYDDTDMDTVAVLSAGIIRSERHRMGMIVSSSYGNSSIGSFQFVGFEYNYLIFNQ